MSRMKIIVASGVIALAIGVIAAIPNSQGKVSDSSKSKIEVVNLGEYGLELIGLQDRAFDNLLTRQEPSPAPNSVVLVNNNDQGIVSCTLKWEFHLLDGRSITHLKTKTGPLSVITKQGQARLVESIPTKGHLLFSLEDPSSPESQAPTGFGFRTGGGGRPDLANLLSHSEKIIVSIDGVLFADGIYAGRDTKNFFERTRGQLEGTRELAAEVVELASQGVAAIFHLKEVAHSQSKDVQIHPGEDPQYFFGKWMAKSSYARLLLLLAEKKGDQAVLDRVRDELTKPQIKLRKLN